jgi:MFS family permease
MTIISKFLPHIDIRKFIRTFVLLFVLNVGFSMIYTLLNSMLLISYGAKIMPLMTMGLGALELLAAFVSAAWAKSKRKTDLLNQIVALSVILIGLVYFLLYLNVVILLPLVFVVLGGLMGVGFIQVDIIINHLFSLDELSVVYPKLTVAYSLSSIFSGILLGSLIGFIGNHQALLIPMIILALSLWVSLHLYRQYPVALSTHNETLALQLKSVFVDNPSSRRSSIKTHSSWNQEVKDFFDSLKSLKNNAILRYLVYLTILSSIGGEFFTFGLNTSATQHFSGDSLTRFLALLDVAGSLCSLIFRLFFLSRTIKRISFSRGYLYHSSFSLLGLALLSYFFSSPHATTYLVASALSILIFLGTLIHGSNSLYRLIPEKERDKARTLTQGIGESISYIISAWIVVVLINILPATTALEIALIPAAVFCFVSYRLAQAAYHSLESMVKGKNEPDILDAVEILAERRGKEFIDTLLALYPNADVELKKKIIYTLGEIRNDVAYRFLHKAVFQEPHELRKILLRSLGKFKGNHSYLLMYLIQQRASAKDLRECLYDLVPNRRKILKLVSKDFLKSADPQVKTQAMIILDDLKDSTPQNLERVISYTNPSNPLPVVGQALKTLYHRSRHHRPLVIKGVERLLVSPAKEEVIVGLDLIGILHLKPLISYLFQKIDNELDHEIKSAALRSLSELNPGIAVDYFSYFITNRQANSAFYSKAFTKLDTDLKQRIISSIVRSPVEAIDHAIRNLMPYSHKIKQEIETLYEAIPQKFQIA